MTSSGTYNFVANFNIAQIIDEAFRRCKILPQDLTAEHMLSASISLNLLFITWCNDGVQQFVIDEQIQPLVGNGTDIFFIPPVGTVDILSMVFRNSGNTDIEISAISRKDYQYLTQKMVSGQPVNYFVDKTIVPPKVFLWPVQNISGTSVVYNRIRQIQDIGNYTNTPDTSVLYKEAICACLADLLWIKHGNDAQLPTRGALLTERAAIAYKLAKEQDRDRARLVIKPRLGRRW